MLQIQIRWVYIQKHKERREANWAETKGRIQILKAKTKHHNDIDIENRLIEHSALRIEEDMFNKERVNKERIKDDIVIMVEFKKTNALHIYKLYKKMYINIITNKKLMFINLQFRCLGL